MQLDENSAEKEMTLDEEMGKSIGKITGGIKSYLKSREPRNLRINGVGVVNEWKKLADAYFGECPNCKSMVTFELKRASHKFTYTWVPIARWNKKYYIVCPNSAFSEHGWEISAEKAREILERRKINK